MRVVGFLALAAGIAGLVAVSRGTRRLAVTEADDDASDWHLSAEPGAGAFSGFVYLHLGEGNSFTH